MKNRKHLLRLLLLILLLGLLSVPVWAAKTKGGGITVTVSWRPDSQLTSIDNGGGAYPTHDDGDDYRYVDLEIMATSNINYWTVQIICQVDPTILGDYTWDFDGNTTPFDWGDDSPPGNWGPELDEAAWVFTSPAPGLLEFTSSKYGYSYPLGGSGEPVTQRLITFRYRVKPQGGVFQATVVPSCTASFLDLNGNTVPGKVAYSSMPPLKITSGYSILGNLKYQAAPFGNAGIGINCMNGGDHLTTTDISGNFALNNLRDDGGYECIFYGNVIAPGDDADLHLSANTWVNLWSDSLQLLPTILMSGNTDRSGDPPGNEVIDNNDIALVTANWKTAVAPTSSGDASGDGFIDKVDLAIVASSYDSWEYTQAEHWIATTQPFGGSIQYSNVYSPHVQTIGSPGQYWPTLSPDGSTLAYVAQGKSGEFTLFTTPSAPGGKAKSVALTPTKGWEYSAFAPSWSPDGTQIAFICAYGDDWMYVDVTHDICVVNANGTGFRNLTWGANLYPPTWFSDDLILYGGDKWDDQTLYMTNVGNGNTMTFDSGLPTGSSMPQHTWYDNGPAIFYVYNAGLNNSTLRFADIDENNVWDWDEATDPIAAFADVSTNPSYPYHLEAKYDTDPSAAFAYEQVSTNIDYYEIAYNRPEIIFTEWFDWGGGWNFQTLHFDWDTLNGGGDPTWWEPGWWNFPGQQGNPWWNGNPNEPTDLSGRRNTVDWTP